MDLDHKGFSSFSQYLCEKISTELADFELLQLIPFYKSYRAFVRGKVAAIKSAEEEVAETEQKQSRNEAKSFFRQALLYAVQGEKPILTVMMGRIGTGKSTQARLLAEATGWPVFSSDIIRKQIGNVPLNKAWLTRRTPGVVFARNDHANVFCSVRKSRYEFEKRKECYHRCHV